MLPRTWLAITALVTLCCGEEPPDLADISRDYCAILMTCKRPGVAVGYTDEAECEAHRTERYQEAAEVEKPACRRAQAAYETCVGGLEWCEGFDDYWSGLACGAETDAWYLECLGVTP
ncbi:hypothetical protein SAMN02745121_01332 [Nannocystis exedens]|uniref:Uncharacterized protein n=1 Tax=Nannocystis exedens TaxID=54 RepID=A0A1I1UVH9_9BACT|nr:hypothetical protein [Nannocystis exedens]PCC72123.1 hypothetical protein NAEX_05202 [Nannocystis exedens]SFD74766.1 hypothetical protein SAMN02745121_01332 [Nannocystis exedens]